MVRSCKSAWFIACVASVGLLGCAMGTGGVSDDDDDDPRIDARIGQVIDASVGVVPDAAVAIDAGISVDAPVSTPDAASGGGAIGATCTTTPQCDTAGGLCCSVLGVCFLDTGIPGICI